MSLSLKRYTNFSILVMLYLSEHFHQKIRLHLIVRLKQGPGYIFSFIGHFLLSLQGNLVLLLLCCKDC